MKLFVCRHALRQDSVDGSWISTSATPYDPPLSQKGLLQAESLGRRIKSMLAEEGESLALSNSSNLPICLITSPFQRCVETALAVSSCFTKANFLIAAGLGEWLTPDYFTNCIPPPVDDHQELCAFAKRYITAHSPHSRVDIFKSESGEYDESWKSMKMRVTNCLESILASNPSTNTFSAVIVITHGACCNALLSYFAKQPILSNIALASFFCAESSECEVDDELDHSNNSWSIVANENLQTSREVGSNLSLSSTLSFESSHLPRFSKPNIENNAGKRSFALFFQSG